MGRKKAINEEELFQATEALLIEKGFQAFHFKELATMLEVGRSTIYEYYRNKEELILAYMKQLMNKIIDERNEIEAAIAPNLKIKKLLAIFMNYAHIHQLTEIISAVNDSNESVVKRYKQELSSSHNTLYQTLLQWTDDAKKQGIWRENINESLIADMFYNAILLPNRSELNTNQFVDQIFSLLEQGLSLED